MDLDPRTSFLENRDIKHNQKPTLQKAEGGLWVPEHSAPLISSQQYLRCKAGIAKTLQVISLMAAVRKAHQGWNDFSSGPGTVYDQ